VFDQSGARGYFRNKQATARSSYTGQTSPNPCLLYTSATVLPFFCWGVWSVELRTTMALISVTIRQQVALWHVALYLLNHFSCGLHVQLPIPTDNRVATGGRSNILRRCLSQGDGVETDRPNRNIHFLILPGFFNDSQDYIMEGSLIPSLKSRGFSSDRIHVVPVKRWDWLTVFVLGVLDMEFWKSSMAPTRESFSWYLKRVTEQVDRIVTDQVTKGARKEDVKVVLIGHSAGGWLARYTYDHDISCSCM
jgi:hypothetical protein